MSDTVSVTVRIDKELKAQSQRLLDDMGMDMTTAYTIFLKEIVRTGTIPFQIRSSRFSPAQIQVDEPTLRMISAEHSKGLKSSKKGDWTSIEDMRSKYGASE